MRDWSGCSPREGGPGWGQSRPLKSGRVDRGADPRGHRPAASISIHVSQAEGGLPTPSPFGVKGPSPHWRSRTEVSPAEVRGISRGFSTTRSGEYGHPYSPELAVDKQVIHSHMLRMRRRPFHSDSSGIRSYLSDHAGACEEKSAIITAVSHIIWGNVKVEGKFAVTTFVSPR